MNKECPIQVPYCPELPTSNYSAEDPDVPFWIGEAGRGYGGVGGDLWGKVGCLQMWCYSTVSQEAANECAALQDLFCGDTPGDGTTGGTFYNTDQTCTATCGAATISFTQPAGTVGSTTSQADADAKAHALACDKVNCRSIFFTCGAMPNGCVDEGYFFHFSAGGGTPPYIFNVISGAQPGGMYLDPSTGDYGGSTSFGGFFNFLVRATDAGGAYVEQMFSFELLGIADAANLPDAAPGVDYIHQFTPVGGLGTLSWAFGTGTPPPGMILDPITGILGGVCNTPGTYTFKVRVTDTI